MSQGDFFYYEVLLQMPFNYGFTYKSIENLEIGSFVTVPFRGKMLNGIIFKQVKDKPLNYATKEIKCILKIAKLKADFISFMEYVARYSMAPIGLVLKSAIGAYAEDVRTKSTDNVTEHAIEHSNIHLSNEQQNAFEELKQYCAQNQVIVLDGVTGSGKTAVYAKAMKSVIASGGQCLLLLPEIALSVHTTQMMMRYIQSSKIYSWHSGMTKKQKCKAWYAIVEGAADLVVGARSALLLPFKNLKMIVVDEEHDSSFKQDDKIIYHGRDMAVVRSKIEQLPIILSSATPSVESFYNIQIEKYKHIQLINRFHLAPLPALKIIDMKKGTMPSYRWLSNALYLELKGALENGKQSLLFLNRKGYAPTTLCPRCLEKVTCKACSVSLVLHKKINRMLCHYCGDTQGISKICNSCGYNGMTHVGVGIDRIEDDISKIFPEARICVLTSEVLSSERKIQQIFNAIKNHKVDIIIGTQVVTKGLNFDSLDCVGIIDGDFQDISGDFRCVERMYQLFLQVMGRAGRKSGAGKAFIQSYDMNNYLLKSITNGSRDEFLRSEIEDRKIAKMPPFSNMAIIHGKSSDEGTIIEFMNRLKLSAPKQFAEIIGPAPSPIMLLKNQYRYRIIIKCPKRVNLQSLVKQWFSKVRASSKVILKADLNPYNFN